MAKTSETSDPTVSIVVPTFNRRERLLKLLSGLDREHDAGSRFELIVSVDGSRDGTLEMLSGWKPSYPCRIVQQENAGPSAARNRAIKVAAGDVLLFLDDDVVPEPGLIERHLSAHRELADVVVIGPMLTPMTGLPTWLRWEGAMLMKQYRAMANGDYRASARQFYTANASVRRAHVLAAGGFDERLRRAEDVELAYRLARAGLGFQFLPDACVLHEPDRSFMSWVSVGYQYGRQDVVMTRTCGHTDILPRAYREWRWRNAVSRAFTRFCVGHPLRLRAATAGIGALVAPRSPVPARLQLPLCSALFNMHYWQGLADASGLGPGVWGPLTAPQASRDESASRSAT